MTLTTLIWPDRAPAQIHMRARTLPLLNPQEDNSDAARYLDEPARKQRSLAISGKDLTLYT
jgi:hypothetical protein